ncbi:MAG: CoA transferase [Reyranella sp.]|uniref:CaiB/BaiF CoA transferase family protein n=1 Tax=Reyranella sp. TaxID=1929291 RepID=UPI00122901FF|nr:CaiB/BaiF CoA-transferase family protein [Reyranella sp.]TAJ97455.1 MAG: CoA transferase [Reyranella sp.]
MSRLPLSGVRVLECASVIAGPYCSYMLTLLGAETIKIERPLQGDWMRRQGGDAALVAAGLGSTFLSCNAGKKSVSLNLKDPRGVQIARELAAGVDVMIENWRPGTAERLGVGFDAIKAVNPRIVYCSISGFGQDGPMSPRPAYDHIIQAVSGIMSVTGTPQTAPSRTGPPLVDYMTGLSAAVAVLAALRERDRTGEAQHVDVGMLDCAVAGMGSIVSAHVNGGVPAAPIGNAAASGAPGSGMFATQTSPLAVVANTEAQYAALCGVLGQPELLTDPRFREPAARKQNQDALRALIAARLAGRPAIEWEQLLAAAGVPCGAVRSVPELLAEQQVVARDLFRRLELPQQGRDAALTTAGFKLNGQRVAPEQAPPLLAADNESVLAELGYDAAQRRTLRDDGVW